MTKNNQNQLQVSSPLCGWCSGLEDSPDPVFRDRLLGDGVSIDPTVGEIRAPFDGEVLTIPDSLHAINLRASNGAEFLIHVGIDTVKMAGDGFTAHVKTGDRVTTGELLLEFDLNKVLRQASSLKTPVLLLQTDQYQLNMLCGEGPIKTGDVIFEVTSQSDHSNADSQKPPGETRERTVRMGLEHGIHARPAARLVTTAKQYQADISIHHADKQASATSIVALMSLGTRHGDTVTIRAAGDDADQALEAIQRLLEPLPAEAGISALVAGKSSQREDTQLADEAIADGSVFTARVASPGFGMGKAFTLNTDQVMIENAPGPVTEERASLLNAIVRVREHLAMLAGQDDVTTTGITGAHLALLDDPVIMRNAEQRLSNGQSAAIAWRDACQKVAEELQQLDDTRMRERADDLLDINLQVQRVLAGYDPQAGQEIPAGSVIIARNMLPSQLLALDAQSVSGICLAEGGATSHVAILALAKGIPMLVAAGLQILQVDEGSELLLDAESGELHFRPKPEVTAEFKRQIAQLSQRRQDELAHALEPCLSTDGTRIHIYANLASASDASAAIKAGAEGCGLLRTEFAFMHRSAAPGIDEQLAVYQPISDALGNRPMVVRTLDAGGDKAISYIPHHKEENPALGVRGVRLSLAHPEILKTQLKALLQLRRSTPLQIMLPMISSVKEIQAVRKIIDQLHTKDRQPAVQLGIMIETPAAALIADQLAKWVDFFSIGTNDLTQYTLCMDRQASHFATDLDVLHPAVLRLIKITVDAATSANIPVGVCGGAGGDRLAAPILLGLGIRELSMSSALVARQKAVLRGLSIKQCTEMATRALSAASAEEVRAMMRQQMALPWSKSTQR